jgi:hypothetical protein
MVPWMVLEICVNSSEVSFESPKSDTLATILLVRRMLLLFTSLWIIPGLQPVCKYSSPEELPHMHKIEPLLKVWQFQLKINNRAQSSM